MPGVDCKIGARAIFTQLTTAIPMKISTRIMSGAGNMFTVIDRREHPLTNAQAARLTPLLCAPGDHAPAGTEGLILLDVGVGDLDFHMEFFNPDGSHGAMCGNGGRCALRFAAEVGIIDAQEGRRYRFDVLGQTYAAELKGANVRLFLPPPLEVDFDRTLVVDGHALPCAYVNVDSDHIVMDFALVRSVFGATLRSFDLQHWGRQVRYHEDLAPRGANLDVYEVLPDGDIDLRTYERGVEAETGACGTGAVATALTAIKTRGLSAPLRLIPPSREMVIVDFTPSPESIEFCILEGPARIIATRIMEFEPDAHFSDQ